MDFVELSHVGDRAFVLHDGFVWIRNGSDYQFYGSIAKWRKNTHFDSRTLTQYGVIAKGVREQGNELETEKEVLNYIRMAKGGELY